MSNDPSPPERETRAGRWIRQLTHYRAFIPAPLPPEPALRLNDGLLKLLSEADVALGRLDGSAGLLPNPDLFVGMYVRQEAVLSSQIEGTQASLTDILQYEAGEDSERPLDVEEVVNYVRAMNHGLRALDQLPLSLRLIREIHRELMQGVRGHDRTPGEFRTTQNWLGPSGCTLAEATFVPPPPHELTSLVGNLEQFLHDDTRPALIIAGLAHAQFETLHPFLDGNGRVGRLLITLVLCERKILSRPLLYLSHFLKQHRAEYYELLQAIRTSGQWEEWLAFFLRGVREVAIEASSRAGRILALRTDHEKRLRSQGKAAGNLLRALDALYAQPVATVKSLAHSLGVTPMTANGLLSRLTDLGLVIETTGHQRNRRFAFAPFLALFEEPVEARP